ncbi:MAG TPA: type II CAAX endopeptidase family protein, partial [Rhodanobacteraceae bacterium]|nr:type II CAAX endopeptidase family protein [Rhodanobacteraceae bacterium]
KTRKLQTVGIAFGLFLAVYVPAFIAVSMIRPTPRIAVPLIIGVSLLIAMALIATLVARCAEKFGAFGFRLPAARYIGLAILLGLPLAVVVGSLAHMFPAKAPLDTSDFPLWMLALYFGVGSPIQEEVIFRGLLQSFVEQRWMAMVRLGGPISVAVLFTSALFGIAHLGSGSVVFGGAIVLGLVAGELRRRSGSLIPAIIVHVLFNVPELIWR